MAGGFLVTLGGCSLLAGFGGVGCGGKLGDCAWPPPGGFVRGLCFPGGEPKATLVDCACHCNLTTVGGFLWRLLRGSVVVAD